jgi:hypothetical protein
MEKVQLTSLELSDEWPADVARLVGLISIAFAQLQRVVYIAAKRKAAKPLQQWEEQNRNDNFSTWCRHLVTMYSDDLTLIALIERAQCAAAARHDLIHAIWGRHPDGALGRWRRGENLGIERGPLADLLSTVCQLRDEINRHTHNNAK